MPPEHEYDLVILGAGPTGEKAAAQAAYFGKRVAIIERAPEPGGAGVHTGTLPSKTLREAALYLSGHRSRELYGVSVELDRDATLARLIARKDAIASHESRRMRENLIRHGVTYFQGHGRIVDPHAVEVNGERITGAFLLVATGSCPRRPEGIDFDSDRIHDTDEVVAIDALPRSMTILGGGVIGCEYACMFAALGVSVTLVDARDALLTFLDRELVERLEHAMRRMGIEFVFETRWGEISTTETGVRCALEGRDALETEHLLFAAGRVGRTADLGLDAVGLETTKRGHLEVDDAYRTAVPSILAAGDIIGFPGLASTAMEQGRVAVCANFGLDYKERVSRLLPYGIYTIPELSAVGENEWTATDKGIDYVVGRALFRNNARGMIAGDLEGMLKLLVCRKTRKLLGVHVIGERASELVHIGQTALALGAEVDVFIDMVFNFPTLAESYKYAAYDCLGALTTASRARRGAGGGHTARGG